MYIIFLFSFFVSFFTESLPQAEKSVIIRAKEMILVMILFIITPFLYYESLFANSTHLLIVLYTLFAEKSSKGEYL